MLQIGCACGAVVTITNGVTAKCPECGADYKREPGTAPTAFRRVARPGLLARITSWFRSDR